MSRKCPGCIFINSACIGPKCGPVRAKKAENACMGPENGPVRARGMGNGERTESPIPERESPAVKAGLVRVYGVVNLYLTFLEDLFEVYLVGIQVDMSVLSGAGL